MPTSHFEFCLYFMELSHLKILMNRQVRKLGAQCTYFSLQVKNKPQNTLYTFVHFFSGCQHRCTGTALYCSLSSREAEEAKKQKGLWSNKPIVTCRSPRFIRCVFHCICSSFCLRVNSRGRLSYVLLCYGKSPLHSKFKHHR
jgi:hypothetical protein